MTESIKSFQDLNLIASEGENCRAKSVYSAYKIHCKNLKCVPVSYKDFREKIIKNSKIKCISKNKIYFFTNILLKKKNEDELVDFTL